MGAQSPIHDSFCECQKHLFSFVILVIDQGGNDDCSAVSGVLSQHALFVLSLAGLDPLSNFILEPSCLEIDHILLSEHRLVVG